MSGFHEETRQIACFLRMIGIGKSDHDTTTLIYFKWTITVEKTTLYCGDCLEFLGNIPAGTVDAIITDPPYGITDCDWDVPLSPSNYMGRFFEITKQNAAICVFGQQPFFTDLVNAARKYFRYEIIWRKSRPVGYLNAKKMPMRIHENIGIFYKQLPTYNPQFTAGRPYCRQRSHDTPLYRNHKPTTTVNDGKRYPVDVLDVPSITGAGDEKSKHPTQKPLKLILWLVKTFTCEGDLVLDPFMGSGTTGVACKMLGRNFIGMERDREFCKIARDRIEKAESG